MSSIGDSSCIYVALLDENVDVYRPVQAERLSADWYLILPENQVPDGESWEFQPGDQVRCELRKMATSDEPEPQLLAVESRKS